MTPQKIQSTLPDLLHEDARQPRHPPTVQLRVNAVDGRLSYSPANRLAILLERLSRCGGLTSEAVEIIREIGFDVNAIGPRVLPYKAYARPKPAEPVHIKDEA